MCIQVFFIISICFFFDGLQVFLQGPIRAMGLQKKASYFAIGVYWLIGVPTGAMLSLHYNYGVLGLQIGFTIAVITQAVAYAIILYL